MIQLSLFVSNLHKNIDPNPDSIDIEIFERTFNLKAQSVIFGVEIFHRVDEARVLRDVFVDRGSVAGKADAGRKRVGDIQFPVA